VRRVSPFMFSARGECPVTQSGIQLVRPGQSGLPGMSYFGLHPRDSPFHPIRMTSPFRDHRITALRVSVSVPEPRILTPTCCTRLAVQIVRDFLSRLAARAAALPLSTHKLVMEQVL